MYKDGKVLSVRIHGAGHVTLVTYWVPIGLALAGLLIGGTGVWLLTVFRRRREPEPT